MIKNVFLLFVAIAATARFAAADSNAQQALDATRKTVNIRAADAKPFQLEADFTAQLNNADAKGHATLRWSGPKLWSLDITLGDYHQLEIHKDDSVYTSSSTAVPPASVEEIGRLLAVVGDDSDWQPKKLKLHTESAIEIQCVELRLRTGTGSFLDPERQLCSNRVTGDVISDTTKDPQNRTERNFADYRPFGDHHYPWQLNTFVDGRPVVQMQLVSLQEAALDPARFTPPPDASLRRHCANLKPAEATHIVNPTAPGSQRAGSVTAKVTIMPDGKATNIQLLESAGPAMDKAAEDALRKWTFKAATCGAEPITSDLQVEVHFHIR